LCSQSILSKWVRVKVFWNKELVPAASFVSAAGLGIVLTPPVCASYCLGKGYASQGDDFSVENGKALELQGLVSAVASEKPCGALLRWTAHGGCPYMGFPTRA
jgi:hypothetical protein